MKPRAKKVGKPSGFLADSAVLSSYDVSKSHYENYKRLALLADANQIGAERHAIRGFKPRLKGPCAEPTGAHHPLEDEVPEAAVVYRQIPEGEHKVLSALVAKYADNYTAMARDMRLNSHQHTAAHLRRRIAKMNAEVVMDAEAAREAEVAGLKPPIPRRIRKVTKDPNPQFKHRSKHFN